MTSTSGSSGAMSGRSVSDDNPSRSRNSSVVANVTAPRVGIGARLGDQPAGQQRAHHRVHVDAAHRAHPRPRHRLPVRHHRQRLQRRAGQLGPGAVEQQPLDVRREPRPGVHPPAAAGLPQIDAAVAGREVLGHQLQLGRHPVRRLLGRRGQRVDRHRGVHHQQQRLERRAEFGVVQLRRGRDVDAQVEVRRDLGRDFGRDFVSHCVVYFLPPRSPGVRWSAVLRSTKPGAHQAVLIARMLPRAPDTARAAPGTGPRSRSAPRSRPPGRRTTPTARFRGSPAVPSDCRPARAPTPSPACRCSVPTVGTGRGVNAAAAICAKLLGVDAQHDLGQQVLVALSPATPPADSCAAPRPRARRTSPRRA